MEWIQFVTLFATMLAGFGFTYREIKAETAMLKADVSAQAARTDKLYEMYCETQREIKELYIELVRERK